MVAGCSGTASSAAVADAYTHAYTYIPMRRPWPRLGSARRCPARRAASACVLRKRCGRRLWRRRARAREAVAGCPVARPLPL
eukprot:scaffold84849_cov31-Phaeocystis_antarctica.AAC.1